MTPQYVLALCAQSTATVCSTFLMNSLEQRIHHASHIRLIPGHRTKAAQRELTVFTDHKIGRKSINIPALHFDSTIVHQKRIVVHAEFLDGGLDLFFTLTDVDCNNTNQV